MRTLKIFTRQKKDFDLQHLDVNVSNERRQVAVEIMYNVFKNLCQVANANLVCNADHLLAFNQI